MHPGARCHFHMPVDVWARSDLALSVWRWVGRASPTQAYTWEPDMPLDGDAQYIASVFVPVESIFPREPTPTAAIGSDNRIASTDIATKNLEEKHGTA